LFLDRGLRMVGGVFVGALVARYLGPGGFGSLNFAIAISSVFAAIGTVGLNGIVVRDLVRQQDARGEILGTALAVRIVAAVAAIGAVQIVGLVTRNTGDGGNSAARAVLTVVSFATIMRSASILRPWFESEVRSKFTVIADNGAFIVIAIVRIALVVSEASLVWFAVAILFEAIVAETALWMFFAKTTKGRMTLSVSRDRAKSLLSEGLPLVLSSMAIVLFMRMDQVMIQMMLGDEAVGIYSAAVRVSEIWYFIPMSVVASVNPWLVGVKDSDPVEYERRYQQLCSGLVALSYAVIIVMWILSPWLVGLLFGDKFAEASSILRIHIWAGLFAAMGVANSRWMLNEGLARILMVWTICSASLNFAINLVLIPILGGVGAAVATLVAQAAAFVIYSWIRRETRPVFRFFLKALILRGFSPRTVMKWAISGGRQ
jgi:O-antigen/teichoic acid export membrane protein